jgi:HlyD family secretion protein
VVQTLRAVSFGPCIPWLLALLLCAVLSACNRETGTLTVSGRIEVDDARIGSKIGGRVAKVCVDEGESVKAGDPVVLLEDQELTAQLNQAKSAQAQAQAQLDLMLAGTRQEDIERAEATVRARQADLALRKKGFRAEEVRGVEAQLAQARSELDLAQREFDRAETLLKSNTIGEQEMDTRRAALRTAQAQLDVRKQNVALYRSGSRPEEIAAAEAQLAQADADLKRLKAGARPEEIAAQRAALEEAKANVARLESQLAETRILAPSDAEVDTLDLEPGDLVRAGETIAVLNLRTQPYVRCYLPENRLGWVKPGQDVEVTVDSFPGRAFHGKVRRISAEAEFTPRNVQTQEKRSELVFEMKVDVLDGEGKLRGGMYADVHVQEGKDPRDPKDQ